jgi:hypothetical protein
MAIDIFGVSISDLIAIIAVGVTAVLFYIGHTRCKKSEQIRVSREIWDRIVPHEEIFKK